MRYVLASTPALLERLSHRNPWVDPLNHLQVELLRRYRSGDDDELVQRGILLTMSGLATALPSAAVIATESVPSVGDTQLRSAEPSVTCWRYGVRANENAAVAGDPWPQVCMMAVRPSPRSAGGLLRSPVAVAPSWPETFAPTPQAAEPATARAMTGRRTRGRGVLCMNA